jgi:hypothetical protein
MWIIISSSSLDDIYYKAKKEGLTSKEYREKYNIPDYDGPKTIN